MLTRSLIEFSDLCTRTQISAFDPQSSVSEYHLIMHVSPQAGDFLAQYTSLQLSLERLLSQGMLAGADVVVKRWLLSDSVNQVPQMKRSQCGESFIQQPPLDGSKVALWAYLHRGTKVECHDGHVSVRSGRYTHSWDFGMLSAEGGSSVQTENLLCDYQNMLCEQGGNVANNCLRTWFFVRDVDTNYAGMVTARRNLFLEWGLTHETHYIASTGIGGVPYDTRSVVQMDAYALQGHEEEQIRHLMGSSNLNPTHEYGVTFERGTRVQYGDRSHVIISGTASIDNQGQVLHENDVLSQTRRMCENVHVLLSEAGAGFEDVVHMIVYLRDISDYGQVSRLMQEKFPCVPMVFTLAPVCRPSWLIEMECMAITSHADAAYENF